MRVCQAHKEKSVLSLQNIYDKGAEYDLCPECLEVFQMLVEGTLFTAEGEDKPRRRLGRPPKRLEAVAPEA